MSATNSNLLAKFGLGVVEFNFDELILEKDEKLPESMQGLTVELRKISGAEFENYAFKHAKAEKEKDKNPERFREVRAELVAMCLHENGEKLFDTAKECNEALNNEFLAFCFAACQQLNGISRKAQDEAEKNS